MSGLNDQNDLKKTSLISPWKYSSPTFRRIFNSTAVVALLLPNLLTVGVAVADDLPTEDPSIEKIEPTAEVDEETAPVEQIEEDTEDKEPTLVEVGTTAGDTEPATPKVTESANKDAVPDVPTPASEDVEVNEPAAQNIAPDQLSEPTEVKTLINVKTPDNMNNYINTLRDFENHPLILTNQVTGEMFRTSIQPNEGNTSNNFQLATTVHAYERGNQPSGRYNITLPQELIDLGYSLNRNPSVQSNFGIVGMTNLSYDAPQSTENVGELARNVSAYSYLVGRDIEITFTALDGQRTYTLGNRNLSLPSGEYNIRITNSPTDSQPQLILRESNLANAPEREISLSREGDAYVGRATFDFTNSTQTQIFKLSPVPLEVVHTVNIDPNGGTIDEAYRTSEVDEGSQYIVPYTFQSDLARPGYTLTGYTVEGTLLDSNGNPVTEIGRNSTSYTPTTDVTLTAIWEVTSGKFTVELFDDSPATQKDRYTVKLVGDNGTEYPLTSSSYNANRRTWEVPNIPNGTYSLVIEGYNIASGDKFGQPDTTSTFVVNDDGTAGVELEFVDNKSTTFIRYQVYGEPIPEPNTVTIDPNGGTIDEGYRTAEVQDGSTYTVPYTFQSNLARPGYTLTGYTVEGTLLDSNGNPVTEISRYTGNFTPTTDVTLTAIWEVTSGQFTIQLYDDVPGTQNERYTLKLIAEDSTEYILSSTQYGSGHRTWKVEDIPNGTYTVVVDGYNISSGEKFGQSDTTSSFTVNDDGTATVELEFADDKCC